MIRQTVHYLVRLNCALALALVLNIICPHGRTAQAAHAGDGASATSETSIAGRVEKELLEVEDKWLEADIHGEDGLAAQLLAEDYQGMTPSGAVQDKAQFVADVKAGGYRADSFYQDERSVRVFGDAVVSTGRLSLKAQNGITQTRYTRVYVKRQGRWQLIIMQATRISRS
jgi:hypothetical protein